MGTGMLVIYLICLTIYLSSMVRKKADAYLISAIIWTGTAYAINEILSLGNNLNYHNMLIAYICLTIVVIIGIVYQIKIKDYRIGIDMSWFVKKEYKEKMMLFLLFVFLIFMFIMSIVCIPYDVDSLTYHLTRIAYWTQNQSVAHYATNDVRAVTSPPLAEFINLQVYILGNKSDLFCNVLQMASYATNAYLVWGIAKKLQLSVKFRYLSVLLFISTPIAFAEALTTQVDQFAALWVMMFVYFILDTLTPDFRFAISGRVISKVLILGACISFGYLTKPTGLFAMFIFALWLLLVCIKRKDSVRNLCVLIGISLIEIVLVVSPEVMRNIVTFHAISASSVGAKHMIDTYNPIYLLINFAKNVSVNLPNIYVPWLAKLVKHCICWVAYKFNIDINDPAIAHDGAEYLLREPQHYVQDSAVNPIILFFTLLVIVWLIKKKISKEQSDFLDRFSYAAIGSFLFLCFVLKYELYSARYMIAYLGLLCPVIAGQISRMKCKHYEWKNSLVPIVVFMCCIELLALFKYHAPIWYRHITAEDRMEGYLEFRKRDEECYRQLGEYLSDKEYDSLGVYLSWGAGEYPIWKLIDTNVRVEAVNVTNETRVYTDDTFIPEYIVVKGVEPNDIEDYMGLDYRQEAVFDEKIFLYKLY